MPLSNLPNFITALPKTGSLLAVDYGKKFCGFAISNPERSMSLPLSIEKNTSTAALCAHITTLTTERTISGIIVGLPLNNDGSFSPQTQRSKQFAYTLAKMLPDIPIILLDESFTSQESERITSGKDRIDDIAAVLILDNALAMLDA